jgi:hypothetical protein
MIKGINYWEFLPAEDRSPPDPVQAIEQAKQGDESGIERCGCSYSDGGKRGV